MGYQGGSALQGCFPIFAQPHFLRLDPLRRHRPNPGRLLLSADAGRSPITFLGRRSLALSGAGQIGRRAGGGGVFAQDAQMTLNAPSQ